MGSRVSKETQEFEKILLLAGSYSIVKLENISFHL